MGCRVKPGMTVGCPLNRSRSIAAQHLRLISSGLISWNGPQRRRIIQVQLFTAPSERVETLIGKVVHRQLESIAEIGRDPSRAAHRFYPTDVAVEKGSDAVMARLEVTHWARMTVDPKAGNGFSRLRYVVMPGLTLHPASSCSAGILAQGRDDDGRPLGRPESAPTKNPAGSHRRGFLFQRWPKTAEDHSSVR